MQQENKARRGLYNSSKFLLFALCWAVASSTIGGHILPAIAETLERRFRLSSIQFAFINSSFDIASLFVVILVCHYGERGHKAHWIGKGVLVTAFGALIMTLPYFLSGEYSGSHVETTQSNSTCQSITNDECSPNAKDLTAGDSGNLWWILIVGQVVRGIGAAPLSTLAYSYLDENVTARESPIYTCILGGVAMVFMGIGVVLGGQMLRFPETPWRVISSSVENMIGCWWPGYFMSAILGIPVALIIIRFPKRQTRAATQKVQDLPKVESKTIFEIGDELSEFHSGKGLKKEWKDMPIIISDLMSNPVFSTSMVRNVIETVFATGWAVFMPKFLQNMYGFDAPTASILVGFVVLLPLVAGTVLGGAIISKGNFGVVGVLRFGLFVTIAAGLCSFCVLSSCPARPYAGVNQMYSDTQEILSLSSPCNVDCHCDRSLFDPVCHMKTGITYFSACYAGCSTTSFAGHVTTYSNCTCMPSESAVLTAGRCPFDDCNTEAWLFIGGWMLLCLFYGMGGVPLLQALLRAVPHQQRTMALGLQLVPVRLFGTIPGPLLMGLIFDSSCQLWKEECGDTFNCLIYDNQRLIMLALFSGLVLKIASALCLVVALVLYKPQKEINLQQNHISLSKLQNST